MLFFFYFLKKGIKNIIQPTKKKALPNIAQKFPRLDIIKPIEEIKNKTQPIIFIILIFTLPTNF